MGKLQGMLLVHENMIVRLSDVLAPHLGLVKDKMAMQRKVFTHGRSSAGDMGRTI